MENMFEVILLLLVSSVIAEEAIIQKVDLFVKTGEVKEVISPGYPARAPVGSNINWFITQEDGGQLVLKCDDIRISPSEDCVNGYFMIYNGRDVTKQCNVTDYLRIQSVENTMRLAFDVNWASGAINCKVSGISNVGSAMDATDVGEEEVGEEEVGEVEVGEEEVGEVEVGEEEVREVEVGEEEVVEEKKYITLSKDEETNIENTGNPPAPPKTSKTIWEITSDSGTQILLMCDSIILNESENCKHGYFMTYDGISEEKHCGSYSDFRVQSKDNTMRLELHLIWTLAVIKCKVKAIQGEYGQTMNAEPQVYFINLKSPGDVYDEINYKPIQKYSNIKWNFETSLPNKLSLYCAEYNLAPCSAMNGYLIANDTEKGLKFCGGYYHYDETLIISQGNRLNLELQTGSATGGYSLNCIVQAISGNNTFEYRNVASEEVDSSEYGRTPGPRNTSCNCGWTAKNTRRVLNGVKAEKHEFPWMVSLKSYGWDVCGGSIITEYHVITAAHCVDGEPPGSLVVFVGAINIYASDGQSINVKEIIVHKDFVYAKQLVNDISLLLLEDKIHFTNTIGPICLTQEKNLLYNEYVTVMGWGTIDPEERIYSPELLKSRQRIINFYLCSFLHYRGFNVIDPDRICTWNLDSTVCKGDSGGPMVWLDPETNMYTLIGLASFGRNCTTYQPSVFNYVPHYYNWIQQKITESMPNLSTCQKI